MNIIVIYRFLKGNTVAIVRVHKSNVMIFLKGNVVLPTKESQLVQQENLVGYYLTCVGYVFLCERPHCLEISVGYS